MADVSLETVRDCEARLTQWGYVKDQSGKWTGKWFSAEIKDEFGPSVMGKRSRVISFRRLP